MFFLHKKIGQKNGAQPKTHIDTHKDIVKVFGPFLGSFFFWPLAHVVGSATLQAFLYDWSVSSFRASVAKKVPEKLAMK